MKKLLVLAALVLVAGCAGVNINPDTLTDCVLQCAEDQILTFVDANGDTITIRAGDYKHWIWKDDGTLELKDKRQ